jgi:hypothetical protein
MTALALQQTTTALTARDPAAVAAAESSKARIQAAYIMALQKRRDEDQARDRILAACRRPAFAERVEFNKPVGNTTIKGPSIRFAELALREWGNVFTSTQVLYEDDLMKRIRVETLDLETNANFAKEIQYRKTVERASKHGREDDVLGERTNTKGKPVFILRATEEEAQIKENALISKTIRNEGLRLIPSDIIDEAIDTARATLKQRDAADPAAAKKAILDNFSAIGVKPAALKSYLGHDIEACSPAELQDLRGMFRAIRDGEATWSDYITRATAGEGDEPPPPPDTKAFDEAMKDLPAEPLAAFVNLAARNFGKPVDEFRAFVGTTEGEVARFRNAFAAWQKKHAKAKPPKAQPAPAPDGGESLAESIDERLAQGDESMIAAMEALGVTNCPAKPEDQRKLWSKYQELLEATGGA